jgi:predicted lysophospholipase L1 biosynthesis ABC-type transport system permease subunit
LLAAFGLHGVISYGVRQRTHEIGARVALGATAARVMGLVLDQAARLAAIGIIIGLAGAVVLSRLIATMLFNMRPGDPWTLTGVVLILCTVVVSRHAWRRQAGGAHRRGGGPAAGLEAPQLPTLPPKGCAKAGKSGDGVDTDLS